VPGGVTVAGEKLHDAPEGNNPVQLNETDELNPPTGLMVAMVDANAFASRRTDSVLTIGAPLG
jgi:hypothetical protein